MLEKKRERKNGKITIRLLLWGTGILLVLGLIGSCTDDDLTGPVLDPDILMTVEFDNYISSWDGSPREGFVFASDQDGRVLDCAPWTSNSTVVLKNTEIHPDKVTFTLFEIRQSSPIFSSEIALPVGTIRKLSSRVIGFHSNSAIINFQHRPDVSRFLGAANRIVYLGQTDIPPSIYMSVYGDSTDMYFMAVPEVGVPVGGWLRSLRSGDRDTMDFESPDSFSPLNAIRIMTPSGGTRKLCWASTNKETDPLGRSLSLDRVSFFSTNPDTMVLYLPLLDPSDLAFAFYQEFSGNNDSFYWQEIQGRVPESFSNLEGDLTLVTTLPDSVVVETSFPWDRFTAEWVQDREISGRWNIKGPVLTEGMGLPEIPQEIISEVPTYLREDFLLRVFEVYQETSEGWTRTQGKRFQIGAKNCDGEKMRPDYLTEN